MARIFFVTEGVDVGPTIAAVASTVVAVATVAVTIANLVVAVIIVISYHRYCYQVSL